MRKNAIFFIFIIFFFLAFGTVILFGNNSSRKAEGPLKKEEGILTMNIRPEIKNWIDALYFFKIVSAEHTTLNMPSKKIRIPEGPKPFPAGRFKITFEKGSHKKAIICQTEEIVGHIAMVVPGKTRVGGYIQLLDNPIEVSGSGPKLNPDEIDYFIQTIYRKFSEPVVDNEADLLNKTKDYALSILFSEKGGIDEYHSDQIKKLRSK